MESTLHCHYQLMTKTMTNEETARKMKAIFFIPFDIGIHIFPFPFKDFTYLLGTIIFHLLKLSILLLFYCTNQKQIPTYSNVMVNQLNDKNQKNQKKVLKKTKAKWFIVYLKSNEKL